MLFRKGFSSDINAFSLETAPNPSPFFNTVNNNIIVILLSYFCNIQINSNPNQGKFPKHFSWSKPKPSDLQKIQAKNVFFLGVFGRKLQPKKA